jgi:capsular polysaccharide biosynthesis protein
MTKVPRFLRALQPWAGPVLRATSQFAGPLLKVVSRPMGLRALPRGATASRGSGREEPPSWEVTGEATPLRDEIPAVDGIPRGYPTLAPSRTIQTTGPYVVRLPGGRVVGDYAAIITPENMLLQDLSPYFSVKRPSQHPIFRRAWLPSPETLQGRVGVVHTRKADNYYHFMIDIVPRIAVLAEASLLSGLDAILAPSSMPYQREILSLSGVPVDRLISPSRRTHLVAEELIVPSVPTDGKRIPGWACRAIGDLFPRVRGPLTRAEPRRRIYISRGDSPRTRRVTNESELEPLLARWDIERVSLDHLSVREQATMFREAELIVAPHGAALVNVAFCEPGTKILELFSPRYVNYCFRIIAGLCGLDYSYVLGEGHASRLRGDHFDVSADITVSRRHLETALSELVHGNLSPPSGSSESSTVLSRDHQPEG